MNYVVMVLRVIFIVAGIVWVGGSLIATFLIAPASAATAEAGQQNFIRMLRNGRLPERSNTAGVLAVLAGAGLYWIDSAGLTSTWTWSGPGWGYGIGAAFALLGLLLGSRAIAPTRKLKSLAETVQSRPTQGQVLELERMQRQTFRLRVIQDLVLLIAVACIGTARYWHFR